MDIKNLPEYLHKYISHLDISHLDHKQVSKIIIEQIQNSKGGKFVLKRTTGYDQFEYITPTSIEEPFFEQVWSNSTLEEKIKSVQFFFDQFFKNNKEDKPRLLLVPKDTAMYNRNLLAYYNNFNNEIFINLNKLENSSGLEFFAVLFHECTHAKDFQNIEQELLPLISQNYCSISSHYPHISNYARYRHIMELPLYGNIYNYTTNAKEKIDNDLKNIILKLKNYIANFDGSQIEPSEIKNKDDFRNYIEKTLYYYSPIERFARIQTKLYLNKFRNIPNLSYKDQKVLERLLNEESYIDSRLNKDKKVIELLPLDFLDMALKNRFYTFYSQKLTTNTNAVLNDGAQAITEYEQTLTDIYNRYKFHFSSNAHLPN